MNRVHKWLYPELHAIDGRRDLEYKVRELIQRGSLAPSREALRPNLSYALVVLIFVAYFAIWWAFPGLPFVPPLLASLLPGILALTGGLLLVLVKRNVRRKAIRRAMVRCGIPICVDCGYDLKGTESPDPCPECGSAYPELGDPATALRLDTRKATT